MRKFIDGCGGDSILGGSSQSCLTYPFLSLLSLSLYASRWILYLSRTSRGRWDSRCDQQTSRQVAGSVAIVMAILATGQHCQLYSGPLAVSSPLCEQPEFSVARLPDPHQRGTIEAMEEDLIASQISNERFYFITKADCRNGVTYPAQTKGNISWNIPQNSTWLDQRKPTPTEARTTSRRTTPSPKKVYHDLGKSSYTSSAFIGFVNTLCELCLVCMQYMWSIIRIQEKGIKHCSFCPGIAVPCRSFQMLHSWQWQLRRP